MSFTEQCPKLLATADDFARECMAKAQTKTYTPSTLLTGGRVIPQSGTVYFRPTDPQSHFSLGCVLNNHDKHKIDYIGVYYATNGANFAIADTDKAEWRNIDQFGDVGLIAGGEPTNFVFVRPFDTGHLTFSNEILGMPFQLEKANRAKNCEPTTFANHAMINRFSFIRRVEKDGHTFIESCGGPNCDDSKLTAYDELVKKTHKHYVVADDDVLQGPIEYVKFFDANDHELIYGGTYCYIESSGALLVRNNVLQMDCSGLTHVLRGTHVGYIGIPDLAREVCNVPHQP
jgi:hypothetical protein